MAKATILMVIHTLEECPSLRFQTQGLEEYKLSNKEQMLRFDDVEGVDSGGELSLSVGGQQKGK